jgi:Calx-beta domain
VDGLQGLVIDDVSVLEGNAGTTTAGFTVTLASPLPTPVSVDYGTSDGTATVSDNDYLPVSGTLVFAPGETTKPVPVGVVGDTVFEADETFFVTLSNVVGSVIVDGVGVGTILNDDSALPSGSLAELVHGSSETRSLETQPGPVAIAQEWRLQQAADASYEVLVDALTGDLGPQGPALDRLASDGSVAQGAVSASGGSSRSLRWENRGGVVTDERVRVQSRGCILDCDAGDTFRVRMWVTTLSGARWNDSASQVTVVVVQDASEEPVSGHVDFRSSAGVLLHSQAFSLGPKQVLVLSSASIPALQGQAGSLSVSHDGRYGSLVGKAVALEPATGFTFDTPLVPRRR